VCVYVFACVRAEAHTSVCWSGHALAAQVHRCCFQRAIHVCVCVCVCVRLHACVRVCVCA